MVRVYWHSTPPVNETTQREGLFPPCRPLHISSSVACAIIHLHQTLSTELPQHTMGGCGERGERSICCVHVFTAYFFVFFWATRFESQQRKWMNGRQTKDKACPRDRDGESEGGGEWIKRRKWRGRGRKDPTPNSGETRRNRDTGEHGTFRNFNFWKARLRLLSVGVRATHAFDNRIQDVRESPSPRGPTNSCNT